MLAGPVRRLDLLRNDGGSVTVDGALVGGADEAGAAVPWRGRIEVDDAVLSDGTDPILACAIGNAGGYAEFDGLPLLDRRRPDRRPGRGRGGGPGGGQASDSRGRGYAWRCAVPAAGPCRSCPATVSCSSSTTVWPGSMTRKRSWWTEPGAWAVYAG